MLDTIIGVGMITCNDFFSIKSGVVSIRTHVPVKHWKFWHKVKKMDCNNCLSYVIELRRKLKLKNVLH